MFSSEKLRENGIISFVVVVDFFYRKSVHDGQTSLSNRMIDDIKASPQGSGSPITAHNAQPSPQDRAAAKRAELRRLEQERRRREAVCIRLIAALDCVIS